MSLVHWLVIGTGVALVVWLGCAIWTAMAALRRGGRTLQWVLFGLLLGPAGPWVVLRMLNHRCPHCRAPVLRSLYVCPNCGRDVPRLEKNPENALWSYRRNW